MNNTFMNKISGVASRAYMAAAKRSPELLIIGGIVGGVTAAVMACHATTKLSEITEPAAETVAKIHEYSDNHPNSTEYTEQDKVKDLALTYAQTGIGLVKLYGPAILVGGVSIAAILQSHRIMSGRNKALAAAVAAVSTSYNEYRKRVIDRFGDTVDKELRMGTKIEQVERTVTDDMGNEQTVTETIVKPDPIDPYTFCFDEVNSTEWNNNAGYNYSFLQMKQDQFNNMLIARRWLCLNDVLYELGMPRVSYGQIVGWVYDPENNEGDNYVKLGFDESPEFMHEEEASVWLHLNCQGDISPLIDKAEAATR